MVQQEMLETLQREGKGGGKGDGDAAGAEALCGHARSEASPAVSPPVFAARAKQKPAPRAAPREPAAQ